MIDTVTLDDGDPSQLQWIESTLQQSVSESVEWVIVVGHYPVWSVAEHGSTPSLQKYLKPLLDQYQVGAYICGHDHDLQYLDIADSQVGFFHSGAGHTAEFNQDNMDKVPAGALKFFFPPNDHSDEDSGLITVSVSLTAVQVDYLDTQNNLLFSVQRPNPRPHSARQSIQ